MYFVWDHSDNNYKLHLPKLLQDPWFYTLSFQRHDANTILIVRKLTFLFGDPLSCLRVRLRDRGP